MYISCNPRSPFLQISLDLAWLGFVGVALLVCLFLLAFAFGEICFLSSLIPVVDRQCLALVRQCRKKKSCNPRRKVTGNHDQKHKSREPCLAQLMSMTSMRTPLTLEGQVCNRIFLASFPRRVNECQSEQSNPLQAQ